MTSNMSNLKLIGRKAVELKNLEEVMNFWIGKKNDSHRKIILMRINAVLMEIQKMIFRLE